MRVQLRGVRLTDYFNQRSTALFSFTMKQTFCKGGFIRGKELVDLHIHVPYFWLAVAHSCALIGLQPLFLPSGALRTVAALQNLVSLAATPSGHPLKRSRLLLVPPPQRRAAQPAATEGRPAHRPDGGGDRSSTAHVVAGEDSGGEAGATRMRLAAARALGQLAAAAGAAKGVLLSSPSGP